MRVFEKLQLWVDAVARSGPAAMAVDEWLLATVECPVLRVYDWAGEWASLGYFGKIDEARVAFPGMNVVRRWTGGGMVDHRHDWTYSLVIPKGEALAKTRGATSYGVIHGVLRDVLLREGLACEVSKGEGETGAASCFENPVSFDLILPDRSKLAGAGQRRSRVGLLHQGSVLTAVSREASETRARELAHALATTVSSYPRNREDEALLEKMADRYTATSWTCRR
ncbi:MAG: hypothetical protein V4640_11905 [Verrucomicrobiota bacterium]